MEVNRSSQQKRHRLRDPLDRRVDQWIQTGRQFVDGVSGNRPGSRRKGSTAVTGSSFQKVSRWVGDKLDWLLEDEDDWVEPWESESDTRVSSSSKMKRPLKAISRRVTNRTTVLNSSNISSEELDDQWPDESSFRLGRWERSTSEDTKDSGTISRARPEPMLGERRPLPRSSRRRQ